jgi:hypothetical protein
MISRAIPASSWRMKWRKAWLTRDNMNISLGRRSIRISITSSDGRSHNVACCLEAFAFRWRFLCRRSVRLERRGIAAVVSTSGSSGSSLSFILSPFGIMKILMVVLCVEGEGWLKKSWTSRFRGLKASGGLDKRHVNGKASLRFGDL